MNASELNAASWYKTDLFERLPLAKSASEMACALSGMPPIGKPGEDESEWMLDLVNAACDIASQWVQRPYTVTIGGDACVPAMLNVAPEQVRHWYERWDHDPMHTLDEVCGHLLQEVGIRKVLTQTDVGHFKQSLRTAARWGENASPAQVWDAGVAYIALSIAGAIHRRNMLKKWGGWASFYRGMRADKGMVQLRLDDPEFPLLMKGLVGVAAIVSGMPVRIPEGRVSDVLEGIVRDYLHARPEKVSDTAKGIMRRLVDALTDPGTRVAPDSSSSSTYAMDGDGGMLPAKDDVDAASLPEIGGTGDVMRTVVPPPYKKATEVRINPGHSTPLDCGDALRDKFKVEPSASYRMSDPDSPQLAELLADLRQRAEVVERALRSVMWSTPPVNPHRGYTSGMLDEGGLHRLAAYNDGRVFERMPEAGEGRVLVGVLLDASGSMAGDPIADARAMSHATATAFAGNPKVRLRCWSHSAHGGGWAGPTVFLDEFDMTNPRECLKVRAGGENADGVAIKHVCSELLRDRAAKRRVLVVVSDGYPSVRGLYTGTKASEHTAASVKSARHAGVSVLSIIIGNAIADADADLMYGRNQWLRVPCLSRASVPLARAIRRYVESASCGT